ncbi:MAG: zinc-binding dehydrogenase [Chloroflexi bacterium]|nr:zinc-binding dehydrogenase [Chloroflexota bacterium]
MPAASMRAVVYLEPGVIALRQVPIPNIESGDLLVRVRTALTCGTDVKTYKRGHPKYDPPTMFGHEFAGDIVAVGEAVTEFEPGMRVVAGNTAPCNACYYCKRGQHNLCDDLLVNLGAFAEYIRVPARLVQQNTFILPDHLSYRQAAIIEPLACVLHGQDLVQIQTGESVAIIGAGGPIGLMHTQLALHQGAAPVFAIDMNDMRLGIARQLGASRTINLKHEDPATIVREMTAGRGADVVIECAGAKAAWLSALQLVRKGGRVLWFGGLPGGTQVEIDATHVHYDEISIFGVYHLTPQTLERAFHLVGEGVIDAKALITHEVPLERLEDGLRMMMAGESLKVAVVP